jgi:tripartite-type tricarboxylate transporter receptor subunit TctC
VATTLRGFTLPPGAPDPWRAVLLTAIEAVSTDPDFVAQCAPLGQTPRYLDTTTWTRALTRIDSELRQRWREEPWLPRPA